MKWETGRLCLERGLGGDCTCRSTCEVNVTLTCDGQQSLTTGRPCLGRKREQCTHLGSPPIVGPRGRRPNTHTSRDADGHRPLSEELRPQRARSHSLCPQGGFCSQNGTIIFKQSGNRELVLEAKSFGSLMRAPFRVYRVGPARVASDALKPCEESDAFSKGTKRS